MVWTGIGVVLLGIVVVIVGALAKRSGRDPGSVSTQWIAEHRADA